LDLGTVTDLQCNNLRSLIGPSGPIFLTKKSNFREKKQRHKYNIEFEYSRS
jgi:hypothetical protein